MIDEQYSGLGVTGDNAGKRCFEQRLRAFAAATVDVAATAAPTAVGRHVAARLTRSSTSAVANHIEAQGAGLPDDLLRKLRSVLIELEEARIWLRIARALKTCRQESLVTQTLGECEELMRIVDKSISTTRPNNEQQPTN